MYPNRQQAYTASQFEGMTPERLVLAMFDGALKHMGRARVALDGNDVARKGTALSKAIAIVCELQSSLNPEAGELSAQLDSLYDFVVRQLTEANLRHDAEALRSAEDVIRTVRDGWSELLAKGASPAAPRTAAAGGKRYV
jgi:flagellar protein FliS